MRVLLIIGSVLLYTGYEFAAMFLIVFTGPDSQSEVAVLLSSGSVVAVVGSVLLVGMLSSNVLDPATEPGRRYLRRLVWVYGVTLAVSIALLSVGSGIRQTPVWVPVLLVLLTIICTGAPVLAAEHYRRRLEPDNSEWHATASVRARTFKRMGLTFLIAAAITAVLLAILGAVLDSFLDPLEIATLSLSFGAISATVPALVTMFKSQQSLHQIFGTDLDSRKAVGRVVVRRKPDELSAEQTTMAARFAHLMHDLLPVQYAQVGALIIGLIGLQLPRMLRGDFFPIVDSAYIVIGVAYIVLFFVARRQYRSVREYAKTHPLDDEAAISPAGR